MKNVIQHFIIVVALTGLLNMFMGPLCVVVGLFFLDLHVLAFGIFFILFGFVFCPHAIEWLEAWEREL